MVNNYRYTFADYEKDMTGVKRFVYVTYFMGLVLIAAFWYMIAVIYDTYYGIYGYLIAGVISSLLTRYLMWGWVTTTIKYFDTKYSKIWNNSIKEYLDNRYVGEI